MRSMMTMPSPIGPIWLFGEADQLVGLYMREPAVEPAAVEQRTEVLLRTAVQLEEYFAGTRRVFDVPVSPRGTEFQEQVWRALLEIPHGETRSYGELARSLGRPSASRAVGAANGRNPISIIVPCHRVIGANGDLTGYGGGMPAKRWLLEHEHAYPGRRPGATLSLPL